RRVVVPVRIPARRRTAAPPLATGNLSVGLVDQRLEVTRLLARKAAVDVIQVRMELKASADGMVSVTLHHSRRHLALYGAGILSFVGSGAWWRYVRRPAQWIMHRHIRTLARHDTRHNALGPGDFLAVEHGRCLLIIVLVGFFLRGRLVFRFALHAVTVPGVLPGDRPNGILQRFGRSAVCLVYALTKGQGAGTERCDAPVRVDDGAVPVTRFAGRGGSGLLRGGWRFRSD